MTDITTLAAAADLHSVSEALLAINALLKESGVWVVLLALIAACYRVAMTYIQRGGKFRRRVSDGDAHPPLPPPLPQASGGGESLRAPPRSAVKTQAPPPGG